MFSTAGQSRMFWLFGVQSCHLSCGLERGVLEEPRCLDCLTGRSDPLHRPLSTCVEMPPAKQVPTASVAPGQHASHDPGAGLPAKGQGKTCNKTSRFRGVSIRASVLARDGRCPFIAKIIAKGKYSYAGTWPTEAAAATAVDMVCICIGEGRKLNFEGCYGAELVASLQSSKLGDLKAQLVSLSNTSPAKTGKASRYKGASLRPADRQLASSPWLARIWAQGKAVYLGGWPTEAQAAAAYDKAVMSVGGNRALNFPERYTVDYAAGLQARGLQDVTEELLGQARDEGQFALMQQGRSVGYHWSSKRRWFVASIRLRSSMSRPKTDGMSKAQTLLGLWPNPQLAAEAYDRMVTWLWDGRKMNQPDRYTAEQTSDIREMRQDNLVQQLRQESRESRAAAARGEVAATSPSAAVSYRAAQRKLKRIHTRSKRKQKLSWLETQLHKQPRRGPSPQLPERLWEQQAKLAARIEAANKEVAVVKRESIIRSGG
ncbi:hypothetical protein WJX84_001521 [Apatococcus fuscideae]|uniref:AP2/ERF domain-containing protein n=1 Tax=Apatococcus fuscideae TaxID=2026836 RepID=A0AAW1T2V7_9CHLO